MSMMWCKLILPICNKGKGIRLADLVFKFRQSSELELEHPSQRFFLLPWKLCACGLCSILRNFSNFGKQNFDKANRCIESSKFERYFKEHPIPSLIFESHLASTLTLPLNWQFLKGEVSTLLFRCSVVSDYLQPYGLQHTRLPCPLPSPRACWNSCPLSWWCHSTILSSVVPFSSLLPSILPIIRVFTNESGLYQWVGSLHEVAQGLELQPQNQSFQWIFRTDLL